MPGSGAFFTRAPTSIVSLVTIMSDSVPTVTKKVPYGMASPENLPVEWFVSDVNGYSSPGEVRVESVQDNSRDDVLW